MSPMAAPPEGCAFRHSPQDRLRCLLAGYIIVADQLPWPGADGLTVEDVLLEYPRAARLGRVPGQEELCRRFPDLAQAVADFFDPVRSTI